MFLDRLFEALACGAVFLSDSFPALVELFDDTVEYHRKDGALQTLHSIETCVNVR